MRERSERLLEALGEIDEKKVDQAAPTERKRFHWRRWTALAAALVLVVGVGSYILPRLGGSAGSPGNSAGGAGADGASVFMSYAGPVFPLTLKEADDAMTAEREITLDFEPWVPVWVPEPGRKEGGYYGTSTDVQVTDAYTLTNPSAEDKTVSVLYPFAGTLRELEEQRPMLSMDGERLNTVLHAGGYSGAFRGVTGEDDEGRWNLDQLDSWEQYKALLEDGSYQRGAFGDYPDLSDVPAIVYEFTGSRGTEGEAPSIQAAFNLDYTKTRVLSFHFNGGSFDYEGGRMSRDYFIPRPGAADYDQPRWLIVLGEDVQNMTTQGYQNGGCEPGQEIGFHVNVRRYETSLEDILRKAAREMYTWWDGPLVEDFEMFFGLMKENLLSCGILSDYPAERYHDGHLDDLDFAQMERVFYLEAEVTVPAGGSVRLTAEMIREGSYDYSCAHTENQGVYGYDMVTRLGSNLTCTRQTAVLEDRGQIEIVRQNFGFDPERGVTRVELDPNQEHYYLEVKGRGDRLEK